MHHTRSFWVQGFVALAVGACLFYAPVIEGQVVVPVQEGIIVPETGTRAEGVSPSQLSTSEMEALQQRKLELRKQRASEEENNQPSSQGLPPTPGQETQVESTAVSADDAGRFHGNPALLIIGRNNLNTRANSTGLDSTLAEPAAANNAMDVFAAGNFSHAESSSDGGFTWGDVPLPGGPSSAPITCCDQDVVIDDARRVIFHSTLYINSSLSNGVVRIFVRRDFPYAAACSYDISNGTNVLPDYPHLGLTKRFLYLTTNNLPASGGSFARIHRINIDQMADCLPAGFTAFTQLGTSFGQRVWVPAEGTNNIETMYWTQNNNSSTVRIFRWSESAAAPTAADRLVTASSFPGPVDCRGGTLNNSWWDGLAATIHGFNRRCAAAPGAAGGPGVLACYWNVGPDGSHTQGHIHSAVFDLSSLALIAQPHVFNNGVCFGNAIVTANKRGDIGVSLGVGGRKGGGGTAAQGFVGIDDEFTPGIGFFQTVFPVASGTHNRTDKRYGDYFTIHPYEPCEKWFTATSYALSGGTGVANVNSRYIEFGRNQSARCYQAHRNQNPSHPGN